MQGGKLLCINVPCHFAEDMLNDVIGKVCQIILTLWLLEFGIKSVLMTFPRQYRVKIGKPANKVTPVLSSRHSDIKGAKLISIFYWSIDFIVFLGKEHFWCAELSYLYYRNHQKESTSSNWWNILKKLVVEMPVIAGLIWNEVEKNTPEAFFST